MSSFHPEEPDLSIWPLTFLQVVQSADTAMSALLEKEAPLRKWLVSSESLRQFGRYVIVPVYYHLLTSGFGAMVGSELVGLVYVRGWHQVMYIETLTTHPDWRRKGVGSLLLQFAEDQAITLEREWMALTVMLANTDAVAFYEKMGYRRGHWRVLHHPGGLSAPETMPDGLALHPLFGPTAEAVYRVHSEIDQRAGDAWAAEAIVRLSNYDPYRQLGGEWVIQAGGKQIGYLNIHLDDGTIVVYVSAEPDWWGRPELIQAAILMMQPAERKMPVCLRLASSGHHDAARTVLSGMGFEEQPAATARMYKRLPTE